MKITGLHVISFFVLSSFSIFSFTNSYALESEPITLFIERGYKIYLHSDEYGEYSIPYKITNGKIGHIETNFVQCSTTVSIMSDGAGTLTVVPPKIGYVDTTFKIQWPPAILLDKTEIQFQEKKEFGATIFIINFTENSSKINFYAHRLLNQFLDVGCLKEKSVSSFYKIYPPNRQIENGILPQKVFCDNELRLMLRANGSSSVCVTHITLQKLTERKLGTPVYPHDV